MHFILNGVPTDAHCESNAPLLYALRQQCGTSGVRFGCGSGQCGACTVLIDSVAEQSCQVSTGFAAGKRIDTPEGLASDGVGAIVQQAFIDEQAAQCGYCINGILMSLTALLQRNATPDPATLTTCLDRHLCRCGTHLRIVRAAQRAIRNLALRS
jgi:aerobic-type carbon monoxide dehydrogenase small subunit (CoxS/CutS family)